jgi:hypothetical protein
MSKRPINYTSRDFDSIKEDLVNYAKRYYPTTFKDFSEASFGAMMLDLVAYVGDQLSFYTDFQANESYMDSAIQYGNVLRMARVLGYKMPGSARSTGQVAFYISVPVNTATRGPDVAYMPILQAGTLLQSTSNAPFTLVEDVDFTNPNNEVTVSQVDNTTGNPTFFAIKAYGTVISGQQYRDTFIIGDYMRFRNIELKRKNITEVMSVKDSQGNEYYEVDYLTQDVVYKQVPNYNTNKADVPYVLRLVPAARRFVTVNNAVGGTFLQFGYGSEENLTSNLIADPADVVLEVNGKNYVSEETFDPANLIQTDKFGVVPVNTTLTVSYYANRTNGINAPVGALNSATNPQFSFKNRASLAGSLLNGVVSSLELENEQPIMGDISFPSLEELKQRAYATFASQNRAVTREDYTSLLYRMPAKFGKVKRCNVVRDVESVNNNLNIYVLSETATGTLGVPNNTLKENMRTWLNRYRMINDTMDIIDGRIINYGIRFKVLPAQDINRYTLLQRCIAKLQTDFLNVTPDIGQAIHLAQIYKLLNEVPGVVDTTEVELFNRSGGKYSDVVYDIESNLTDDGRYLIIPQDAAAEVLFSSADIEGVVT